MAADRALAPIVLDGEMTRAKPNLSDLETGIGYVFRDAVLLKRALTHVSAASAKVRRDSYQQLEFLGDRVLGLVVADMLLAEFPDADEGDLSRRLAELVRRETCTEIAQAWGVAPYLRIGAGEAHGGARKNAAILADACESIIGAVYLDGGFDAARTLIRRSFGKRLHTPVRPLRDAKTHLQEWAQGQGKPAPTYHLGSRSGPDHAPHFVIEVRVDGLLPETGEGRAKRDAEQAAAAAMLARENITGAGA